MSKYDTYPHIASVEQEDARLMSPTVSSTQLIGVAACRPITIRLPLYGDAHPDDGLLESGSDWK
jgi:hypothetical protein